MYHHSSTVKRARVTPQIKGPIDEDQSILPRSADAVFLSTGEDLAQGVGFWYAFLTSFWGPKTMVLSKREGLLPGPGLALSFWFPFFLELWLLSSCCLGLFSGAILVAIPCLDTGWILAWSFGCLFLLLFWLALSLLSWSLFCSLLLCSWVPGTRVGSLHGRFSSC